jgi:hypothetical protein
VKIEQKITTELEGGVTREQLMRAKLVIMTMMMTMTMMMMKVIKMMTEKSHFI